MIGEVKKGKVLYSAIVDERLKIYRSVILDFDLPATITVREFSGNKPIHLGIDSQAQVMGFEHADKIFADSAKNAIEMEIRRFELRLKEFKKADVSRGSINYCLSIIRQLKAIIFFKRNLAKFYG